jgi:hypothetical protein
LRSIVDRKDLVIGCIRGYEWPQVRNWVNSLSACSYTGDRIMIVHNGSSELIAKLTNAGFNTFAGFAKGTNDGHRPIVVDRFWDMYQLLYLKLERRKYRYLITTDVKDVIFQTNPSEWLERKFSTNADRFINIGSESISYKNEDWGRQNLVASYPFAYQNMKEQTIYNAGALAGHIDHMEDLFLQIFTLSLIGKTSEPDQAALNIIMQSNSYRNKTIFNSASDGWACQAGTTADPTTIERYRPYLLDEEPFFDGETVWTDASEKTKYCLVHQYDRVPEWKTYFDKRYR